MDASRSPANHLRPHAPTDLAHYVATLTSPHCRPGLSLPIVREMAARALAERIGGDVDALAGQLTVVTRHARSGKAIAAALEAHFSHVPEEGTATILDDFTYELLLAHDRLVAAWAAHHGIRPALGYGDMIRVETNDPAWNRVEVEGEIVGIDLVHAKYRVFSAALGHVRSGPGPTSRAIPFEDVRSAEEEEAREAA
ncbi:MAG TPA: hypothetical protein VD978_16900 [Azospirillum sp.]|nr:hypothetical protein [Azospirillum sp.]